MKTVVGSHGFSGLEVLIELWDLFMNCHKQFQIIRV